MHGAIDYVVIAFPGNKFKGEILPELAAVVDKGLVRIVDLLFVHKDESGNVTALQVSQEDAETAAAFAPLSGDLEGLLSEEDVEEIADLLENNSSAGILVYENLWTIGFKQAVLNANGKLLAQGRIESEIVEEEVAAKTAVSTESVSEEEK
jgi:hypothetical protein